MNKQKNSHISYKKIIALSILFIVILGISVLAGNVKVNSVKIRFSNNHEITLLTSKTKVSEILEENHIMISSDEVVTPALEEEITSANAIVISLNGQEPTQIAEVNNESLETNIEESAQSYTDIIEEIITVKEEIPFVLPQHLAHEQYAVTLYLPLDAVVTALPLDELLAVTVCIWTTLFTGSFITLEDNSILSTSTSPLYLTL